MGIDRRMPRLLAIALILLPTVALAQEVPAEAQRDLWCGTAFDLMTRDVAPDAPADRQASAKLYADGGQLLIQRAIPIYLESGYSDAALAAYRTRLEESVGRIVNGSQRAHDDPTYSFQDCSALIGQ